MALKTVGKQKVKELIPKVISVLKKDTDENVRAQAAICLGEIGEKKDVAPVLFEVIETDTSIKVKVDAINSLGKLKDTSLVDKLADLVYNKDFGKNAYIREAIANSIGEIGLNTEKTRKTLITLLDEGDKDVRKKAILALEKIGEINSQYLIIDLVDIDPEIDVRLTALDVLSRIGSKKLINELESIKNGIVEKEFLEVKNKIPEVIKRIKERNK
jgi:HEAT repeat protein